MSEIPALMSSCVKQIRLMYLRLPVDMFPINVLSQEISFTHSQSAIGELCQQLALQGTRYLKSKFDVHNRYCHRRQHGIRRALC